ncbi:MAG: hypothetical protein GXX95_00495 [Methanomassiliicoccus sp.]|nr:hypothetical protein [Methanomassiliicoccus sp.]
MAIGTLAEASDCTLEEAERFCREVIDEVHREERMLSDVNEPRWGEALGWVISLLILAMAAVIVVIYPIGFLFWALVAFLLYSFNFIIWFVPTTKGTVHQEGWGKEYLSLRTVKDPFLNIVKKKKVLGLEILITMFLSGMVPLAPSFFVLFGSGILFGGYYGFIAPGSDPVSAINLILQMIVILLFFILLVVLEPQERGLARTARRFKGRFESARRESITAVLFVIAIVGLFFAIFGLLFIGAILFPGGTWEELLTFMKINVDSDLLILVVVFIAEIVLMRHLQSISGRRMSRTLLNDRIDSIRVNALAPVEEALSLARDTGSDTISCDILDHAETSFYSIVIYDLFEHNFFGYWPVYVVGPNLSVVLDEEALTHVH